MSSIKKFRAWSNEHNRYCDFVTLDENGKWIGWVKSSGVYLTTTDIVLEQDTGLKDKNGEKICEGDIVKNIEGVNETAVCVWDESNAEFDFRCKDGRYTRDNVKSWLEMYEVIGNIHEKSELLEDENGKN